MPDSTNTECPVSYRSVKNKQLEGNILKYSWIRIFNKRVYLPLITIQLAQVGRVSLD